MGRTTRTQGRRRWEYPQGTTRYSLIERILRERITSGEWSPEVRLPTEAQLCDETGVSRITIRRALEGLVRDGLIARQPRKGTFVVRGKQIEPLVSFPLLHRQTFAGHGVSPHRIVRIKKIRPVPSIAKALRIDPDDIVIEVVRRRFLHRLPIVVEKGYIPVELLPRDFDIRVFEDTLFADIVERALGRKIVRTGLYIEATLTGPEEAALLRVPVGSPAILVERIRYAEPAEEPVLVSQNVMRGDRFRYSLDVSSSMGR